MRFTFDSNILVYATDRSSGRKHRIASDIMIRATMLDAVLTAQALAEYLNVVRRKAIDHFDAAIEQAGRWALLFPVGATAWDDVAKGAAFAQRHRLQLWDSIIWQVARSLHATMFLSEDLQDGLSLEGMTVLNPFSPVNEKSLKALLTADI